MNVARLQRVPACILFVAVASSAAALSPAQADEAQRSLKYVRAPGTEHCPDERYLRASVKAELGYEPFDDSAAGSMIVTMTRTPSELVAVIEKRDENGGIVNTPKKLTAPPSRCEQLIDSVAFMISAIYRPIVIELPVAAPAAHDASPTPPAATSPRHPSPVLTAPRTTPPPPSPRKAGASRKPGLAVSIDGGASFLNAPGPAPTFTLGAGVRWPRLSLAAEGRYDLAGSDGGRRASHLGAAVVPCVHQPLPVYDLVVPGCLFLQIGQVAVGVDGKQLPDYTDVLVGVGARVGLERFFLGPLGAHIELDATYYLSDVVLRLDGAEVWRLPDVSFAVRVGLDGLFDVF